MAWLREKPPSFLAALTDLGCTELLQAGGSSSSKAHSMREPTPSSFYVDCRDEQASLLPAFVPKQPSQPAAWHQEVCGVQQERFKNRELYNGGASWRLPQCLHPVYIHHVDTGEWDECCYKSVFSKKKGIFGGARRFHRCSPMEVEMRDYQHGQATHMCGGTRATAFDRSAYIRGEPASERTSSWKSLACTTATCAWMSAQTTNRVALASSVDRFTTWTWRLLIPPVCAF